MGLDMYLHRKVYVKNWNYQEHENKVTVKHKKDKDDTLKVHPMFKGRKATVSEVIEEVMYWRKANAIHQWFVNNVQNGEDDCGDYYVELEQLEELLEYVKEVLKDHSKATDLLPTQSGFFFGGTDYDEWYFQDLENTKEALETIITDHKNAVENGMNSYDATYEYSSSW
jgi:hypothetical protein